MPREAFEMCRRGIQLTGKMFRGLCAPPYIFDRMLDFRKAGKTMLVVSHSPATLRHMCDRAIWLSHGTVAAHGSLEEVLHTTDYVNGKRDRPLVVLRSRGKQ